MKKIFLLSAAFLGLAAISSCNKEENEPGLVTYEISVEATTDAAATRALALSGRTLNAVWASADVVTVYKGNTSIGTLKPQTTGSASTTLKGTVTASGLSAGTQLRLLTPKASWLYTGQNGTFSSVSSKYSFASATVAVTSVSGSDVVTAPASFENQQAIVKFTLTDSAGKPVYPETLRIEAAGGKLVKSVGNDLSVMTGYLEVETDDDFNELYVALRNDLGTADTYTLTATVGKTKYIATKSGVLFENGKYYAGTVKMAEEAVYYTVAGAPADLFGTEWDATNTANDMVKQADGTYLKTYNVTKQLDIAFKVLKNHDWGTAGVNNWPEDDISITADPGPLKITFDPETKKVSYTYTVPSVITETYTVAGDPASVFGTAWDPSNTANDMVKQADGNYAKSYSNVPAGTELQFKVAVNHAWTKSYGYMGGSGNVSHTMSKTGTLTIHFNTTTHYVTATED